MEKASTIKLEINWFNKKSNFFLASEDKICAHSAGIDQHSHIREEASTIEDNSWKWLQIRAVNTICLYLMDDMMIYVLNETFLTML